MCAFQCFQGGMISASCVADCVAQGCAKAQYFVDQVLNCAFMYLPQCFGMGMQGIVGCIMNKCGTQIAACIGSTC
jgi:hypothetical protein